jgi:hypothetical protein
MPSPRAAGNPFALMLHPQAVLAAIEASPRLGALRRRVCRPLDRGLPGEGHEEAAGGQHDDARAVVDDQDGRSQGREPREDAAGKAEPRPAGRREHQFSRPGSS